MREGIGAGAAAVLVFFCLPLFVHLGTSDLDNDEAIYSFAVDRMVATGDWLVPRMIATGDGTFLEKPPLKFWIVALPIRAGWLPSGEFGLRFWDALSGAASFLYVFLIGTWLLNPVCGFLSVLLLFAHAPLLFSHGFRSNTMDSTLVLAYCGGIYHYLRWTAPFGATVRLKPDATYVESAFRRTGDIFAVALFFVLGFMTKFVAAAFLPLILGLTALSVREHRRRLACDWRTWTVAAAVAVALIAPWFLFAWSRFGTTFWRTIVGVHVYQRFTSTLDPGHLQPWHYYLSQMFDYWETGALILVASGLGLVAGWTSRRYAPSAIVLVTWLLPLAAISVVTSKLYHYAFPFLPALALMGGYFAAIVPAIGWAPFDRALDRAYTGATSRFRVMQGRLVRVGLVLAIGVCLALAVGSLLLGRVELQVGSLELASAGVLRPGLAAFLFGVLLMPPRRFRRWLLILLVGSLLPLQGYRDSLELLFAGVHPRRSVSECIAALQAGSGAPRGLRVADPVETISHSVFYYFDRIQPWRHTDVRLKTDTTNELKPDTTNAADIPALVRGPRPATDNAVDVGEGTVVLLPPAYSACASAGRSQ